MENKKFFYDNAELGSLKLNWIILYNSDSTICINYN